MKSLANKLGLKHFKHGYKRPRGRYQKRIASKQARSKAKQFDWKYKGD